MIKIFMSGVLRETKTTRRKIYKFGMRNSEIYAYMNEKNPNYCKTRPTHGFGANWCQNALLVLEEVYE